MPGQEQGWGRGWERLGQGQGARAEERLAVAAQVPGRAGLSPACLILGTARSRRAAGALGASPARPGVCAAAGPGIRCPSERVCPHLKPDRWVWREWHCWGRGFLEVEQRDTVRWEWKQQRHGRWSRRGEQPTAAQASKAPARCHWWAWQASPASTSEAGR